MKIDLHIHSQRSDGTDSIDDLLKKVNKSKIKKIAITDHDTTNGLEEIISKGNQMGIEVIPGIEISSFDFKRNRQVHILGYNFNIPDIYLEKFTSPIRIQRKKTAIEMVNRIIKAGYKISYERVYEINNGCTDIFKTHIMHALCEAGYCEKMFDDSYKKLFKKIFSDNGIASIKLNYPCAKDAIQAIKKANGIAVLAHPGLYKNIELIPELVKYRLDGIEVYHPGHNLSQIETLEEIADALDLIKTGGTDYHGGYSARNLKVGDFGIEKDVLHAVTYAK